MYDDLRTRLAQGYGPTDEPMQTGIGGVSEAMPLAPPFDPVEQSYISGIPPQLQRLIGSGFTGWGDVDSEGQVGNLHPSSNPAFGNNGPALTRDPSTQGTQFLEGESAGMPDSWWRREGYPSSFGLFLLQLLRRRLAGGR